MIKSFLISFVSFVVLDFLWLGFFVKDFNLRQLAAIGRIENGDFKVFFPAALAVYFLMAAAIVFFILPKLQTESSWLVTFLWSAFLGLIIFGVFDMTNMSILKDYPLAFMAADMIWGTFVFGVVGVITKKLSENFTLTLS